MAISYKDLALKLKAEYPAYKDVEDSKMVKKFIADNPQYESQIIFEETAPSTVGGMFTPPQSIPQSLGQPQQPLQQPQKPEMQGILGKINQAIPKHEGEKRDLYNIPSSQQQSETLKRRGINVGPETVEKARPFQEATAKFGEEFINTALLNMPKAVLNRLGYKLPGAETTAGKIGSVAGTVAGALTPGGLTSKITKGVMAAKAPKLAKIAGAGVASGAAWTPENKEGDLIAIKDRLKSGALTGAIAGGLGIAGKGVSELGKTIRKNIGGISDWSLETINRLGVNKVFQKGRDNFDYLSKDVVPKVNNKFQDIIKQGGDNSYKLLTKLGLSTDDAEIIKKLPAESRKFVSQLISDDTDLVMNKISKNLDKAKVVFKNTLKDAPEGTKININTAFNKFKNNLKKIEAVDLQGNPLESLETALPDEKKLLKVYNFMNEKIKTSKGLVNKDQYNRVLTMIDAYEPSNNKFARFSYQLAKDFREDATKAIPKLKDARSGYAQAKNIEKIAKSLQKIGGEKGKNLKEIIQSKVKQISDLRNYQGREAWKDFISQDVFDDIDAYLVNQDFGIVRNTPGTAGGIFPSKSGLLRAGVSDVSKRYEKLKPVLRKTKVDSLAKKGLEGGTPAVSTLIKGLRRGKKK